MKKAVSIRVIILAAAVVCLVIWGAWKNLPTATEPQRLDAAAVAEELLGAKVPQGGANALLAQENTAQPVTIPRHCKRWLRIFSCRSIMQLWGERLRRPPCSLGGS